jgi:hypothetical protein
LSSTKAKPNCIEAPSAGGNFRCKRAQNAPVFVYTLRFLIDLRLVPHAPVTVSRQPGSR